MRAGLAVMVSALGLGGCLGTSPGSVGVGQEFELKPTETVFIEGTDLNIGFRRVTEDSRCPVEALCVWAGNGAVELDLFGTDAGAPVVLNTLVQPTSWKNDAYELKLLELQPYPSTRSQIKPENYRARLVVLARQ